MRAAAMINHRDPRIAEGMVDERTVIDSLKEAGRVITFTTSEAIKNHYCEAEVNSLDEILRRNNIKEYDLEIFKLSFADKIVAFFMNPLISGFLILIILAGLYFEFQAPGSLFPIAAAMIALTLYLVPYYLNGLAENWEIALLFAGILLVMAEIFVIPGFGIAGVAGITFTIASLILIMVKNDFFNFDKVPMNDLWMAGLAVVGGFTGGALLLFFGGASLSQTKAFKRIALMDTQKTAHGYTVNTLAVSLIGVKGVAWTVLRPSGKVMIGEQVYDAFTRGEYLEKGSEIIVISTEGISLQVRSV
jgi:membrane-bound serine protease (ClpP class)